MKKSMKFQVTRFCISILLIFCLMFSCFMPDVIKAYAINSEDLSVEALAGTDWSIPEAEKQIASEFFATTIDGNSDTDRLYMDSSYFANNCVLGGDTLGVFKDKYKGFCPMSAESEGDAEDASGEVYGFTGLDLTKAGIESFDQIPFTNLSVSVADVNEPDNWLSNFFGFVGSIFMGMGVSGVPANMGVSYHYGKKEAKINEKIERTRQLRDKSNDLVRKQAEEESNTFVNQVSENIRNQLLAITNNDDDDVYIDTGDLFKQFYKDPGKEVFSKWNDLQNNKNPLLRDVLVEWNNWIEMKEKTTSLQKNSPNKFNIEKKEIVDSYNKRKEKDCNRMFNAVEDVAQRNVSGAIKAQEELDKLSQKNHNVDFDSVYELVEPDVKELQRLNKQISDIIDEEGDLNYLDRRRDDLQDSIETMLRYYDINSLDDYIKFRDSRLPLLAKKNDYEKGKTSIFSVGDTNFIIEVGSLKRIKELNNEKYEYELPITIKKDSKLTNADLTDFKSHDFKFKIKNDGTIDYGELNKELGTYEVREGIRKEICEYMFVNSNLEKMMKKALENKSKEYDQLKKQYPKDIESYNKKIIETEDKYREIMEKISKLNEDIDGCIANIAKKMLNDCAQEFMSNKSPDQDATQNFIYYDDDQTHIFDELKKKLGDIKKNMVDNDKNSEDEIKELEKEKNFSTLDKVITGLGIGADVLGAVCYAICVCSHKDNKPLKTNVNVKGTGDGCLALKIGKGVEESTTNSLAVEIEYRNQETGERKVVVEDGLRTPLDYDEYLKYLDDTSPQIPEDEYGWHKIKELGGGFIPTALFIRTSGKTCDEMADEINTEEVKIRVNTVCSCLEQWSRGDIYNTMNGWAAVPDKDITDNLNQTIALYDKLSTNSKKKVKLDCAQTIDKIKNFVPRYCDLTAERFSVYEAMIAEIEILRNDMYFLKSASIFTIEDLYKIANSVFELNTLVSDEESANNFKESISDIYNKFKAASFDIVMGVPNSAEKFTSLFKFTTNLLGESHNLDEQLDFINKIQYMYNDYIIEANNLNTIEGYVCNTPYYNDINKEEILELYQEFGYALDNFISVVYSDSYAKLSLLNCTEEEYTRLCEEIESLWDIKFDAFTLINTIRDLDYHFRNL